MIPPPCALDALEVLKGRKAGPNEARFVFRDAGFDRASVKVLPGEYFVYHQDVALTTTLGSCVAACLHDAQSGIGGMNHFMLPDGAADAGGRFGVFAMELLINEMLKRGARRGAIEAKIFGGGQVMKSLAGTFIGEKNVAFVRDFLKREGIPVRADDVLGIWPRKIVQFPRSGQVLCRRLAATHAGASLSQEEKYRSQLVVQARGGEVELFS
jgi:chemotaxis protein CheD